MMVIIAGNKHISFLRINTVLTPEITQLLFLFEFVFWGISGIINEYILSIFFELLSNIFRGAIVAAIVW